MSGFQAAYRDTCQSVLVGFEYGILFRAVVDQPPVLKLGVMTAGFPLQDFRPVLRLSASRDAYQNNGRVGCDFSR